MTLLLGIDLGTSYFKVGLFDLAGALKGLGRVAVAAEGSAGIRELPSPIFWHLLRQALADALAEAKAEISEIVGISYSSQANTFILLDRYDKPLTPFVLWTDSRGDSLDAGFWDFTHRAGYARRVGHAGIARGAVAKWLWMQKHRPEIWKQTHRIMMMSDYFTYQLTGEIVGDAGTAAFLGVYDLHAAEWWSAALRTVNVDKNQLSRPLPPGKYCGRTCTGAKALLNLPAGIPFAVGSLDHHMAALGSGLGRGVDVSISTGTVLAAVALAPEVTPQAGCYHGPHFNGDGFFRLAFDTMGAGQLEDYQKRYAPKLSLEELLALAALAEAGRPPLRRPHESSSSTEHGIVVRYMLEKIAVDQLALIRQVTNNQVIDRVVATGGGARSALWLQIQADTFGVPISMPRSPERACLGAAMLASVAARVHGNLAEAAETMLHAGREYAPDSKMTRLYQGQKAEVPKENI